MQLVESSVFPGPLFSSCKKTPCGQRLRKKKTTVYPMSGLSRFHSTPSIVLSQHLPVIKKKFKKNNLFLCTFLRHFNRAIS